MVRIVIAAVPPLWISIPTEASLPSAAFNPSRRFLEGGMELWKMFKLTLSDQGFSPIMPEPRWVVVGCQPSFPHALTTMLAWASALDFLLQSHCGNLDSKADDYAGTTRCRPWNKDRHPLNIATSEPLALLRCFRDSRRYIMRLAVASHTSPMDMTGLRTVDKVSFSLSASSSSRSLPNIYKCVVLCF